MAPNADPIDATAPTTPDPAPGRDVAFNGREPDSPL
jgi:hypothetical protein